MHIIAGYYRQRPLVVPKRGQTRPTSSKLRAAFFNMCQHTVEEAHFLDLFAGSGAMGLEALSRGAASATFIDNDQEAIQCIKRNIATLKVENSCHVYRGSVFALLAKLAHDKRVFNLIFADPPYHMPVQIAGQSAPLPCSSALVLQLDQYQLLPPGGWLFVEEDVRAKPILSALKSLVLEESRQFGDTILQRYRQP